MKAFLSSLNGAISAVIYVINTIFWVIPLLFFSLLKLLPIRIWRKWMSWVVDGIASLWIAVNNLNQRIFSRTKFVLSGKAKLSIEQWYLVISNHQSWVDILVLQRVFNYEIPFLKFFLKKNLIYVPFLGLAWWALDFPFMQRYSRAFLEKHPHLKGKDLETTKKACEKFESKPVSIMNFVEGTRFSKEKRDDSSEFKHLLPPRSGGIAFVLNAMGERLTKLVNVTIYYPNGIPSYWDFVCGRVNSIAVYIDTIEIKRLFEEGLFSEKYFDSESDRQVFQQWVNQLWLEKDQQIEQLSQEKFH
ncbi:acyltransferase [Ningiella sp. W23]|uniref:acyltransferase n=1 Tax=Ningiella sp. W23 TaxID=3023715 RepID=UPI00375731E0